MSNRRGVRSRGQYRIRTNKKIYSSKTFIKARSSIDVSTRSKISIQSHNELKSPNIANRLGLIQQGLEWLAFGNAIRTQSKINRIVQKVRFSLKPGQSAVITITNISGFRPEPTLTRVSVTNNEVMSLIEKNSVTFRVYGPDFILPLPSLPNEGKKPPKRKEKPKDDDGRGAYSGYERPQFDPATPKPEPPDPDQDAPEVDEPNQGNLGCMVC